MTGSGERVVIRSYRRVFCVDRRIYRVDRWVLPVPGGVPLRAVAYFAAALLAVLLGGQLPGIGALLDLLNAPLRYVIVPVAIAVLGVQAAPDGRLAHRFAADWLRLRLRSRRRSAGRRVPVEDEPQRHGGPVAVAPDAGAPQLGRAVVRGPATVRFRVPVSVGVGRRGLVARADAVAGPSVLMVPAGQVLEVRS